MTTVFARALAVPLALLALAPGAAGAQPLPLGGIDAAAGLPRGALVFHGNYCGPGNRGPGLAPVDALDRACMHHDACTPTGRLPACSCNDRLHAEAARVSASPRQPDDLRALAGFVSEAALALPCQPR